ncbi:MAG: tRNA threonylcarbamoyladenosine dehydratase [Bacteroidota bacterium]
MNTDWQERSRMLLGETGLENLSSASVLVAGLGGVGSWAAEHLARSGVGHIGLIDDDRVSVTNINRQLPALHSTIGRQKTSVMRERLQDINPQIKITVHPCFITGDSLQREISIDKHDYVLDCIDTLTPKIELISHCLQKKVPHMSSLGSAGKTDPRAIQISDISKSYNCNLGRILRKRLHRQGIYKGFPVVFSTEKTDKSKIVLEQGRHKVSNAGTISPIPSIFGSFMAAEAIRWLVER